MSEFKTIRAADLSPGDSVHLHRDRPGEEPPWVCEAVEVKGAAAEVGPSTVAVLLVDEVRTFGLEELVEIEVKG